MTDSTDEDGPDCHHCGGDVASTENQRVISTIENGKALHTYFCSDDCLASWES